MGVSHEEDQDYARRRARWDRKQAAKMRVRIEALEDLYKVEDVRRARDDEREPPAGWIPEPTVFGTEATEQLRRALGDGE